MTQESDTQQGLVRFSIAICTNGRATALRNTLDSLRYLNYPAFEVCVVYGPTDDGTREMLAAYSADIKVAPCPKRNLSMSRNIAIALSSGDVVAFLDDDAIPEPEWLDDLAPAYADPQTGGAGGFVYDHTGVNLQYRFGTANRMGRGDRNWNHPAPYLCFPFTRNFPHLLGTNSTFRRCALLQVGGFDEEFDYFLDETDVTCRLVDAGWLIAQIEGAYVHHRYLPSSTRNQHRVVRHWYPVIKNKIYYSLRHRQRHHGIQEAIDDTRHFVEEQLPDLRWAISQGYLTPLDERRFWREVDRGWQDGLTHALTGRPRLLEEATLRQWNSPFRSFARVMPTSGRRTFCFVSQTYPPGGIGGIGRYTHELARGVAALGHQVHVVTKGEDHDRVDFEEGVWVHRLLDKPAETPQPALLPGSSDALAQRQTKGSRIPDSIWSRAVTVSRAVDAIAAKREVTAVCAPIWDCEGLAVLAEGRLPLVTALQTPLAGLLATNPTLANDQVYMRDFARPMLAAETRQMTESHGVIAISGAIVHEIEHDYGFRFDSRRLTLIPLGCQDWTLLPSEPPDPLPNGTLRMVYVGRLEARKGTDILMKAAKRVLARYPHVHLDIVGKDNEYVPPLGYRSWRESFEADREADPIRDRVTFHGEVSDTHLHGFLAAADIFVAPSRFESFGLMLLEAMMFGKPVVGANAGGMVEVVEHGVSGLLAEPGDDISLDACLSRLIEDKPLRARMGAAARARYECLFTAERMAQQVADYLTQVGDTFRGVAEREREVLASHGPGDESFRQIPSHAPRSTVVVTAGVSTRAKANVVIIAPMVARYDAISAAVRDTYRALAAQPDFRVSVLTFRNDLVDIPATLVRGIGDLLVNPTYLDADLIVHHFGIYSELFNAIILGNGKARQVGVFHNVTPRHLARSDDTSLITDSYRQIFNFQHAEEVWAVSQLNQAVLEDHGVPRERIRVIPLAVDWPQIAALADKRVPPVELLFVGRIVPSKGVLDLVYAAHTARQRSSIPFRLRVAGALEWCDKEYLDKVRDFIAEHDLRDTVTLSGEVSEKELAQFYAEAHILMMPSYHEGFCKPVVEALRAGCLTLGYTSSNLPSITNGMARLVPMGESEALGSALTETMESFAQAFRAPSSPLLRLDRGRTSLREFDMLAHDYVRQFTFDNIATQMVSRARAILADEHVKRSQPTQVEAEIHELVDATQDAHARQSVS